MLPQACSRRQPIPTLGATTLRSIAWRSGLQGGSFWNRYGHSSGEKTSQPNAVFHGASSLESALEKSLALGCLDFSRTACGSSGPAQRGQFASF